MPYVRWFVFSKILRLVKNNHFVLTPWRTVAQLAPICRVNTFLKTWARKLSHLALSFHYHKHWLQIWTLSLGEPIRSVVTTPFQQVSWPRFLNFLLILPGDFKIFVEKYFHDWLTWLSVKRGWPSSRASRTWRLMGLKSRNFLQYLFFFKWERERMLKRR